MLLWEVMGGEQQVSAGDWFVTDSATCESDCLIADEMTRVLEVQDPAPQNTILRTSISDSQIFFESYTLIFL